jgi:hypothetical protein
MSHAWPPQWKSDTRAQTARAAAASSIDTYEAAVRAVTELEWSLARSGLCEPISSLTRAWADLTRDATAVQLSTARWILDL